MQRQQNPHRLKSHTTNSNTKRAALGNTVGKVPPAWRSSVAQPSAGARDGHQKASLRRDLRKIGQGNVGSKIFMSQLPPDVQEPDIEELFRETIGPVFDVFVVHNSQGRSKGMAVVNFQRPGDAAEARTKFNGKFIDGSRPLKIELITDPPPEAEKTLAQRLGDVLPPGTKTRPMKIYPVAPQTTRKQQQRPQWRNMKKGPRRLKKSVEQLDREMEAYRAEAPRFSDSSVTITSMQI